MQNPPNSNQQTGNQVNREGEEAALLPLGESEISANFTLHYLNQLVELDDWYTSKLILKFDGMFNFIQLQKCEQDVLISQYNLHEALN